MSAQADPYIRIYRRVRSDDRFEHAYSCDVCLAAYLRLLLDADACYPMPASVPRSLKAHARTHLLEAGIIEAQPADCYIIHGLSSERERRSEQARLNVTHRYAGTTAVVRPNNNGSTPDVTSDLLARAPNQTKPNQTETSQADASASAYPDGDLDCLDTYHDLSLYSPWGQWSGDKLKGAIGEYGNSTVDAALRAEHGISADRKTLLDRTLARLARDADRARDAKPKPKPRNNGRTPEQEVTYQDTRRRLAAGEIV